MALIQCNECNGKVSDKAAACIHCGNPFKGHAVYDFNRFAPSQPQPQVQTVEQTSKDLKAQLVYSTLALFAGIFLMVFGAVVSVGALALIGFILTGGSIIWHCAVKLEIWWQHG